MRQKPVTEGMTKEQLDKFYADAREERRGNTSNAWDVLPAGGISRHIDARPMSDDLSYGSFDRDEYKRLKEDQEVLENRPDKQKLIEKWNGFIEKMKDQIKRIQSDATLPTATKQRKINRCLDIIKDYEHNIAQAREYLATRKAESQALYQKHMKQK